MKNVISGLERNYDGGSRFKGKSERGGFGGGSRGGDRGGRGGFGGGSRGGDRGGPRTMHSATCAECNKPCEVPFKPSGNKPVLCSNCFAEQSETRSDRGGRDMGSSRSFSDRPNRQSSDSHNSGGSQKLEVIAAKLDKIIELLSANSGLKKVSVETSPKVTEIEKKPAELTIKKPTPVSKVKSKKKSVAKKIATKKSVKKTTSKKK
ncbi:MAG TPA: CxxC-x17-CxxC domain-containing protein [Patescibacteria group bacterium]|nr:CxxC-x17-CxxC domain-containing protein [Patescibacteria group bacterium]